MSYDTTRIAISLTRGKIRIMIHVQTFLSVRLVDEARTKMELINPDAMSVTNFSSRLCLQQGEELLELASLDFPDRPSDTSGIYTNTEEQT